ncbi:MAG: hypothetical protein PUD85_02475 [Bacteroidales bacterium]|nr:hypothetical protein [Bacteroidales bacterium]
MFAGKASSHCLDPTLEATSLRLFRPASITDIIFFMLCAIAADADDCSPPEPVPPSAM